MVYSILRKAVPNSNEMSPSPGLRRCFSSSSKAIRQLKLEQLPALPFAVQNTHCGSLLILVCLKVFVCNSFRDSNLFRTDLVPIALDRTRICRATFRNLHRGCSYQSRILVGACPFRYQLSIPTCLARHTRLPKPTPGNCASLQALTASHASMIPTPRTLGSQLPK